MQLMNHNLLSQPLGLTFRTCRTWPRPCRPRCPRRRCCRSPPQPCRGSGRRPAEPRQRAMEAIARWTWRGRPSPRRRRGTGVVLCSKPGEFQVPNLIEPRCIGLGDRPPRRGRDAGDAIAPTDLRLMEGKRRRRGIRQGQALHAEKPADCEHNEEYFT